MGLPKEDLYDAYFEAEFDQVFDFVINQTMFGDYGNIALKAVEVLSDIAKEKEEADVKFKSKIIDLTAHDKVEKRLEDAQQRFTELLTEYEGEPEKFQAVCKFIWDYKREYFDNQIWKYLESE